MIIGGIAGIVSRTITAPLELYKIQEQNRYIKFSTPSEVIKQEGVIGLWKGNFVNCIRIFPQMAINYSTFQFHKEHVFSKFIENSIYVNFLSGTAAGIISMSVIYPLENIRSRLSLQTNNSKYTGVIDVFRKTKIRTLYNGLLMSIYGFAP